MKNVVVSLFVLGAVALSASTASAYPGPIITTTTNTAVGAITTIGAGSRPTQVADGLAAKSAGPFALVSALSAPGPRPSVCSRRR